VRPQWLRDRQVTVLMQGALKSDPELPGIPNALEFVRNEADRKVLELHFTQKTAARPLVAPPEAPAERVEILRHALEQLAEDKEFLADANKAQIQIGYVPGAEIDKVVRLISSTPPEITDRFLRAFAPMQR
jgi:hypothetical protein